MLEECLELRTALVKPLRARRDAPPIEHHQGIGHGRLRRQRNGRRKRPRRRLRDAAQRQEQRKGEDENQFSVHAECVSRLPPLTDGNGVGRFAPKAAMYAMASGTSRPRSVVAVPS